MSDNDNITDFPNGQKRKRLQRVKAGVFLRVSAPARQWFAYPLIPAGTITLLNGDGGAGKSLLALQLATSSSLNASWLGMNVRKAKVIYLSAEDDVDELHRRIAKIAASTTVGPDGDINDLVVSSLAGEDAVLAVPNGPSLKTTPLFHEIAEIIDEEQPGLLVLDTLADMFAGDENQRTHARQFISLLRGLCSRSPGMAILVLAHPSMTGLQSGRGTSGSTGWSNSVRSWLYLDNVKDAADLRVLQSMKANYSRRGARLTLRWEDWIFSKVDEPSTPAVAGEQPGDINAESTFLRLLAKAVETGEHVSDKPSAAYAPSKFAQTAEGAGVGTKALKMAMDRLLDRGAIKVRLVGFKSKKRRHLFVAEPV